MAASLTRRAVIGGSAALAAGVALVGASSLAGAQPAAASEESSAVTRQLGFLVITENCTNCHKCVRACRDVNGTPADMPARRHVEPYENQFGKRYYVSSGCMHCEKPACATVCPAGAISKQEDGIVVVNHDRCIGCKYCFQACPFGVPHYSADGMDKCDCCLSAGVVPGQDPYCVQACQFGALQYGSFDQLSATVGRRATRVECSTEPCYLLQ